MECVERDLDPLTTNLVVADATRTDKTICLAVSPSLKACGIPGRPRLFEVIQRVREVNRERLSSAIRSGRAVRDKDGSYAFSSASFDALALADDPALELSYIVAPPRMARYMEYSTKIYGIYLQFIAPEDILVYSIDEVFIDATAYLETYHMTAHELAMAMIREVLYTTGITATAGIGTNLYLAKVAMDIVAKRVKPDRDGVRLAELDEMSYRRLLWDHTPLTDFWRVGRGYANKLEAHGMYTMGDVARCSLGGPGEWHSEDLLYELFGVNAELLIDHAWGWEPCTLPEIKAYQPRTSSLGSGQVLSEPYTAEKARIIVREMTDLLALDLVDKRLVSGQLTLTVSYDVENLRDPARRKHYRGPVTTDHYGRQVPKHAHGTLRLERPTSSTRKLTEGMLSLYDRIVDQTLLVRRITLSADRVEGEAQVAESDLPEQLDLFTDYNALRARQEAERAALEKERRLQEAVLGVKKRFGKNAILKGTNFQEGATTIARNNQIGGHHK